MGKNKNKNKQNGESDNNKSHENKNQQNGDNSENNNNKSDNNKKNQCKEIVLKVYMHCEGCASQVSHCLRGYDGVEQIKTEMKDNKVVVTGKFDDPVKILKRVQKKFSKNAELISPKPNPKQDQKKEPQPKKENAPQIKTVILKMNMHCEGCVNEIKSGIEKIKGVHSAEPDRSKSTVVVRGIIMEPPKLVEKIKKKLGKHAELLSQNTEKGKDGNDNNKNNNKNQDSDGNKIFSYPPQYSSQHAYPSQMFSDENVHSCSIM